MSTLYYVNTAKLTSTWCSNLHRICVSLSLWNVWKIAKRKQILRQCRHGRLLHAKITGFQLRDKINRLEEETWTTLDVEKKLVEVKKRIPSSVRI